VPVRECAAFATTSRSLCCNDVCMSHDVFTLLSFY
jgi:hypothetical protein